ncbi:P-loop containing nucleoside triphosphate hydrolase protein, partial [Achaetomium macrosporum]
TTEGVAEMFRKPLFQITCGDLGTTASEAKEALETNFALASRWECILLLDEADVFLATRSKEDFKRNGLVSLFLRVLEYYAGVLFLTTSRIGDFDEAFASRIHISLHYSHLDFASTEAIFRLNLRLIRDRFSKSGRPIEIEGDKIIDFARHYFETHKTEKWNGRQIRNACQTALALAEYRAQGSNYERVTDTTAVVRLELDDLKVVSNAYLQFMKYLNEVRGKDGERWAKRLFIRAREMDVVLSNSDEKDIGKNKEKSEADGKKKVVMPDRQQAPLRRPTSTHDSRRQLEHSNAPSLRVPLRKVLLQHRQVMDRRGVRRRHSRHITPIT